MIEVGRICVKLAGRDAGRKCVIVDVLEGNYVLIDGDVRRRKCNIFHLEATQEKIDLKKGATHDDVKKAFSKLKLDVWETKPKEKTERPRKIRKTKVLKDAAAEEKKKPAVKKKEKKTAVKEKKPIDEEVVSITKKEETEKKPEDVKKAKKDESAVKKETDANVVSVKKKSE